MHATLFTTVTKINVLNYYFYWTVKVWLWCKSRMWCGPKIHWMSGYVLLWRLILHDPFIMMNIWIDRMNNFNTVAILLGSLLSPPLVSSCKWDWILHKVRLWWLTAHMTRIKLNLEWITTDLWDEELAGCQLFLVGLKLPWCFGLSSFQLFAAVHQRLHLWLHLADVETCHGELFFHHSRTLRWLQEEIESYDLLIIRWNIFSFNANSHPDVLFYNWNKYKYIYAFVCVCLNEETKKSFRHIQMTKIYAFLYNVTFLMLYGSKGCWN